MILSQDLERVRGLEGYGADGIDYTIKYETAHRAGPSGSARIGGEVVACQCFAARGSLRIRVPVL
jgi:hypothetical protein